jgi:hypothetical protein
MGDVVLINTGDGVFTGRLPHILLSQMKGSSNKRAHKNLITGSLVAINDLVEQRPFG